MKTRNNVRTSVRLGLLAMALLFVSASAVMAQPKVLLLYMGGNGTATPLNFVTEVDQELIQSGQFAQVDFYNVQWYVNATGVIFPDSLPTAALLEQYDAIMVFSQQNIGCGSTCFGNYPPLVPTAKYAQYFSQIFAQFADSGGGVVRAGCYNYSDLYAGTPAFQGTPTLANRAAATPVAAVPPYPVSQISTYEVMVGGYHSTGSQLGVLGAADVGLTRVPLASLGPWSLGLGTVPLPNHPIMNGVHSWTGGYFNNRYGGPVMMLAPGAYVVAYWNDNMVMGGTVPNTPLIAVKDTCGRKGVRRVDLDFDPGTQAAWLAQLPYQGANLVHPYDTSLLGWVGDGAKILVNSLLYVAGKYSFTLTNPAAQSFKSIDSVLFPAVQITNGAITDAISLTLRFQITPQGGGAPVYTHDTVLTAAHLPASGTSITVQFPGWTPQVLGTYEDTVIILNSQPVHQTINNKVPGVAAAAEFRVSYANDIQTTAFVDPLPNSLASAGTLTPIIISFENFGGNNQVNVPVMAIIKDSTGAVLYRDTEYALNWLSGQVRQVQFPNWFLPGGTYTFIGIALLPTDEARSNDTVSETVHVRIDYDAAAVGVVNPKPNEQKPFTLGWQPTALFQSNGQDDLFDLPVRVQIRRCSDGVLVFQADSTIPALNTDQNQQSFSFPSKQGSYDITKLLPGCYSMCAITLYPADAIHTNDTTCTQFVIIDRLKGDYLVGVGQQFPSIHAAVDSMRFRGIGANVRLILTDNSYTENGTDTAATKFGALDFRGIRGLADTATVTWIPNTGIAPRITFTGNKQFCFYFGDLFGGHMIFEGYNPAGAPIPDKLIAEPNKRGITIVNNLTASGAVFAFEEGASNITLKDLVLTNNGKFSSDSDAVVRVYNEQSRSLYTGNSGVITPVTDTVPIHNIRVENCELGNAKYGIWDHALHTQFNIGKSIFVDWRNYNNVFTRNTIGTTASPLSYTGIQFNNELNLTVSHNEISNITGSLGGFPNVYGIDQPSVLQSDTGDIIGAWIDANRVHSLTASSTAYGIAFQQAATIYTVGTGPNAVHSTLPSVTSNRTTNNMIFDLRGSNANYPLMYTTTASTYSTDRDSIFNNSISTRNATINIFVAQAKHAFLWNNIIQNTGAGPYTNYSLQLPRPFTSVVSSDFNLFDLRGTNTFATVSEYDLNSGTFVQNRTFRRLNDWRTYSQQDPHSMTGDPLFVSDSLHEPGALSYTESPASNSGAWLGSSSQLRDFDGDLRLQGNQTPDIGADEFDGFQYTNDLATLSITTPAGYSATSDTTSVTTQNPLWVTAQVKNLSSQAVFNVPVSATVEVAISGGPWTTIYSGTTSPMNFEVNETKSVTFQGPTITQAQAQTGVFRITVTTPNDQNNANNSAQKIFRVLIKNNATLVTYTSTSPLALHNRDSVTAALRRLGIAYDSLDRGTYGSQDIDYTPWWTLIWSADSTAIALPQTPRVNAYQLANFTATWKDISTTGTSYPPPATGATFGSVPLPFNFYYDGAIIPAGTILHAGGDGAIALDPNITLINGNNGVAVGVGNSTFPGLVCFFQGGRNGTGSAGYYQVDGTAPNRVLTIEYSGWFRSGATGSLPTAHIQVKLYETTGVIEFIYLEHNLDMGSTAIRYNDVGLNGLSTNTTPSQPSFVSQAYPGYAVLRDSTPPTDIRWTPQVIQLTPGPGGLSFKETQDVERYLQAGQTYAKKSLIMAGQNIAFSNAFLQLNNSVTDTEFMKSYLHTVYRANAPTSGAYNGTIQGQQTDYWTSADHLNSTSPDVVAPSFTTPTVGSEITGFAYAYLTHPATPSDSGAGTTYTNPKMNTVFYGFDWSDPTQTTPSESGSTTSGTTRILKGALDFITSHSGTILPVEFTDVTARRINGNGLISWTTAHQLDVARFEIERQDGAGPAAVGTLHAVGSVSADMYAFTDEGIDRMKTYTYRIAAVDLSGAKTYSPEAEIGPDVRRGGLAFTLDQNYPNPASGLTSIEFNLPVDAVVTLRILDVTGKVISTEIENESMPAGGQTYTLDASKYASGSYIYELTAMQPNGQALTLTKKMTLDK